ncbi:MAG: HepT-like ribonuclease domain-containing protein [Candidatus Melainabacteria bacterium]|jgi:uncharacterized protein with HEPN domain|nr:HepT-like ribonuclease domain-containing protein [Candidatus Melainabacteria bacterium]
MRDDRERLLDILDSISLIEKYLLLNKDLYHLNEMELMGIVRCIEIIGEASRCLSEDCKNKYNQVPWRQISNMRNILVHQYFEIDTDRVESVIKKNIPELKVSVEEILKQL